MKVSEQAKAILALYESGDVVWGQGSHEPLSKCACLLEARDRVVSSIDDKENFRKAFKALTGARGVVVWNDAPDRTYTEVKNVLERLAEGSGDA